jgi:hypothetical protein
MKSSSIPSSTPQAPSAKLQSAELRKELSLPNVVFTQVLAILRLPWIGTAGMLAAVLLGTLHLRRRRIGPGRPESSSGSQHNLARSRLSCAVNGNRSSGTLGVFGAKLDRVDHEAPFVGAVDFTSYKKGRAGPDELGFKEVRRCTSVLEIALSLTPMPTAPHLL